MKIIIVGAGRVGLGVAESLVSEKNDITVIDNDADRLRELQQRLDLRGVVGSGTDPAVLAEAGAKDTDLLISCASQDEVNLVCCKLAWMLYQIPTRIARVRAQGFEDGSELLSKEGFAVDHILCPEDSLTRYIGLLVEYPEALQVREFAGGRACLVSARARQGAPAVGMQIRLLRQQLPEVAMRIVAIYRRFTDGPDRFVACDGDTRIEPGDEVFVLAGRQRIAQVLASLHRREGQAARAVRRIMVAGGSSVGERLAQELARQAGRFHIKLIEGDAARCEQLAARVPAGVLVLHGEASDEELLSEEGVEEVDLFLSLSEDDEDNIMSSLLAKRMGARRVLALIDRHTYADLMHGTQIDIALSPAQTILGELLTYVRRGDVQAVHSLRRGVAEALEVVVRGDRKNSRVVGRAVQDLPLPPEVHIGLIVRGLPDADAPPPAEGEAPPKPALDEPEIIIPHSHTVLESNDHVVFFLPRKRLVKEVEALFRVRATFF
ncbi:MAG: Trk system potassium transport protein TrkA [Comamonas sp. SCN 65-56]|uniref:Trk system potassium transporter TrkA n=1 Tax=Comamonas sp. SCN 65-56 TaxID=1660095 RepID=UPI00086921F4|nr:Trk system potassium transporter TrkA [Comamonas sp. SCN 65-56]ODS90500.1 MAG: Trk system potassium transport protein TrkA [Comamonas sp. SCN 65-56]